MKLADDFDLANDVTVELRKFFSGDPVFAMDARTCYLDWKLRNILSLNLESQHIAGAAISRVLIAGNLDGIFFFEHRVEDWLLGQAAREGTPTAIAYQRKFGTPNWSVEGYSVHDSAISFS